MFWARYQFLSFCLHIFSGLRSVQKFSGQRTEYKTYVRKTHKRFAKSHFLFFGKIVATEDVPRKPELQCDTGDTWRTGVVPEMHMHTSVLEHKTNKDN